MKKSFLFVLMMSLILVLCSCKKSGNLFGEKVLVITSTDFRLEGVIHVHETYEYAKSGMPERQTVSQELFYDDITVPDKTATFSYNKEKGEIVTDGVYAVQRDDETEYVQQTLTYDPKGRLLSWQTSEMTSPVQYTYDAEGHLTQIQDGVSTTTMTVDRSTGDYTEKWELMIPGLLKRLTTVRYDMDGNIERWQQLTEPLNEDLMASDVSGQCTYYEEDGRRGAAFQIRTETEGEEESIRGYGYVYGTDGPDPKEAGIGDDAEETGTWSFSYTYDGDRLLREERYLVSEEMDPQTVTTTYTYDENGDLSVLTQQSEGASLTYTFAEVTVIDPVIRSFLLTKPSILNGTYLTEVSDTSLFELTDDNQVFFGLEEHYCYHCARLMPAPITTCPYCGTEVNPVHYVTPDIWTLDGSLLK